jgi:hypothetical protein
MAKTWGLDEAITPAQLTRIETDIEQAQEDAEAGVQTSRDNEILIWMGAL